MDLPAVQARRYGGRSAAERREDRRVRLLDAGLELFGTAGLRATTIKDVCVRAGLNERYFYESFTSREDLLLAVYERSLDTLIATVLQAVEHAPPDAPARARAGLQAFVETLASDRRRARIQLLEVVGVSDDLERARRARMHRFSAMITALAGEVIDLGHVSDLRMTMLATALVGATNELMVEWILGDLRAAPEEIVEACTDLFTAAARSLA